MKRIGKISLSIFVAIGTIFALIGAGYVALTIYLKFFFTGNDCVAKTVTAVVSPNWEHTALQTTSSCGQTQAVQHWLEVEKAKTEIFESKMQGILFLEESIEKAKPEQIPRLVFVWRSNNELLVKYPKNHGIKLSNYVLSDVNVISEEQK